MKAGVIVYLLCAVLMVFGKSTEEKKVLKEAPVQPIKRLNIKAADINCLASALHYEAGNQGEKGQKAVADVVLNRVQEWDKTVCQVIWQPYQFSYLIDRKVLPVFPKKYAAQAEQYLIEHLTGQRQDSTMGSKWFARIETDGPFWRKLRVVKVIGDHKFMKEKK